MRLFASSAALLFVIVAVCSKSTIHDADAPANLDDYPSDDYLNVDEDEYDDESVDEEQDFKPPTIQSMPINGVYKINETVQLPCDAENIELYVMMWKKNNQTITQGKSVFGNREKIAILKNGALQLKNIQESDAGNYTCLIVTGQNHNVNITHRVETESAPKIVSLRARDNRNTLVPGQDLELTCKASGRPKPSIKWYFKRTYQNALEHEGNMLAEGETITIENVEYHRTGLYRCLADNGLNPPAHDSISIHVHDKPVVVGIEKIYSNSELRELVCLVHSTPIAEVHWEKDGQRVIENNHLNLSSSKDHQKHTLAFASFKETDEGHYACRATNSLGSNSKDVQLLRVPERPQLSLSRPHKGKSHHVEWTVHSHVPILESVIGYKEKGQSHDKEVFPTEDLKRSNGNDFVIVYTFTDLKRGSYTVKMKAKNKFGWSMYSEEHNFEIAGPRHSHKKHHGSHMKDNDVMNRADSHTEEKEPENQQDAVRTGSQTFDSGVSGLLPSLALLCATLALLRP